MEPFHDRRIGASNRQVGRVSNPVSSLPLGPRRVLRDDVESKLCDGRQPLAGVLRHVPHRVLLLQILNLPGYGLDLRKK